MAGSHEVTGSNPVFSTIFCDLFSLIHTYFGVIVKSNVTFMTYEFPTNKKPRIIPSRTRTRLTMVNFLI